MGLVCIIGKVCLPERGIGNSSVFSMEVKKLRTCVWIVYPVRLEELSESRGLVWVLGERCMGRGHDADNQRYCGSTGFWGRGQEMALEEARRRTDGLAERK